MRITLLTALCVLAFIPFVCAQVQIISVDPAQTDARVQTVHGNHMAFVDTTVTPRHKLLLWIVGTDASASHNIPFDSFAAAMGYHVISLDYKNTVISTVCSNSTDSACFTGFRQEIIFGDPVSTLVQVDSANSIYHRLYQLLVFLSGRYPRQGWQQYLKGNTIQWPEVIAAGHSQGAGHAAYLGKKFPLYRVLMFAGPQDYLVNFHAPAGWIRQPGATHPERYFAFLHLKDPYDVNKQLASCTALMKRTTADTLLVQPGMAVRQTKQVLLNNMETANPHESMMQPVFMKAWAYLLADSPGK